MINIYIYIYIIYILNRAGVKNIPKQLRPVTTNKTFVTIYRNATPPAICIDVQRSIVTPPPLPFVYCSTICGKTTSHPNSFYVRRSIVTRLCLLGRRQPGRRPGKYIVVAAGAITITITITITATIVRIIIVITHVPVFSTSLFTPHLNIIISSSRAAYFSVFVLFVLFFVSFLGKSFQAPV